VVKSPDTREWLPGRLTDQNVYLKMTLKS
jgi:hypothetical protein